MTQNLMEISRKAPNCDWDYENGVWKTSVVPSHQLHEIPEPLYIFAYGSLIWRPGENLDKLSSFPCRVNGFRRIFAQRSMDHRGTPDFPGLVLTLIADSNLIEIANITPTSVCSECYGLVYLVPKELSASVLADLDFREKGGYSRHIIPAYLLDSSPFHSVGERIHVVAYIGDMHNPNFHLPIKVIDGENHIDMSASATIISSAKGPSGKNSDYLFNLNKYIRKLGFRDDYLFELEFLVKMRLIDIDEGKYLYFNRFIL